MLILTTAKIFQFFHSACRIIRQQAPPGKEKLIGRAYNRLCGRNQKGNKPGAVKNFCHGPCRRCFDSLLRSYKKIINSMSHQGTIKWPDMDGLSALCACGEHAELLSLDVVHPNTDWCNIAGKASDMHVEVSLRKPCCQCRYRSIYAKRAPMRWQAALILYILPIHCFRKGSFAIA